MTTAACTLRTGLVLARRLTIGQARCKAGSGSCTAQQLRCRAATAGLSSPDKAQEHLIRRYLDMLLDQNKVMNLTAVQTPEEAWERHAQDSLALLPIIDRYVPGSPASQDWIDIGSGAGLPGLILAIMRPNWNWTLLDSVQKRCHFVERVTETLEIRNVRVEWARAEAAGQDQRLREGFDGALARAVAELRTLAELSLPFVRIGGCLIAAKGPDPKEEVRAALTAIEVLGGKLAGTELVDSFSPDGQRTAVVVRKVAATPEKYPRKEGRPQKRPL